MSQERESTDMVDKQSQLVNTAAVLWRYLELSESGFKSMLRNGGKWSSVDANFEDWDQYQDERELKSRL
jgi:hypothetical protein